MTSLAWLDWALPVLMWLPVGIAAARGLRKDYKKEKHRDHRS